MNRNILRFIPLALLVSAAAPLAAALAPVTELGDNSAVKRLERMLEARNQMQLDMQTQLDHMAGELDQLRGTIERNSFDINQMMERQRDIYKEIDALRNVNSAPQVPIEIEKSSGSKEVYSKDKSENARYGAAVDLILKEKNYSGAIDAFNAFLKKYPQSVYQANAHYWLAQLYLSKNDLKTATMHFSTVSKIKGSNKRADAMFKLGVIEKKQGNANKANTYFNQVITEYPDTSLAVQAKKEMK